jgi:DNA-3-methyladenine glycosylase
LFGDTIWIADVGTMISNADIISARRIGVEYAGPDAAKLWRFYLKENPWISRA